MSDDSSSSVSSDGLRQRQKYQQAPKAISDSTPSLSSESSSESSSASASVEKKKKKVTIKDDEKPKKKDETSASGSDDEKDDVVVKMKPAGEKDKVSDSSSSKEEKKIVLEEAAPPAKKPSSGKGKEKVETSDEASKSEEKPKPQRNLGRSGRDNLKKSWKEDDLEIIIPDSEEGSTDSSQDDGAGVVGASDGVDYFARVPDEVILNVYGYLDEQMIGRAAQVCGRWNSLTFDDDMWQEKAQAWGYIPKNQLAPGRERTFYVQKFQEQKSRQKAAELAAERNRKDTKKRGAADLTEVFLYLFFFNRVVDYISIFCLILTTIFATLKLEGAVDWTWRNTLIPIYIPIFQIALTIPSFDLARKTFGTALIDDRIGPGHAVWQFLFARYRKFRGMTYSLIMCLLIFFILLIIKLNGAPNGETGLPLGVVFIPLFLLILITFTAPLTGCGTSDTCCGSYRSGVDRIIMSGAMIVLFLVFLFITLKVDGVIQWDWYIVLIPLWLLFCLIICMPVTLLCLSCCCDCWEDNSRLLSDKWVFWNICMLCWVFLLAPFLTWFSLIALNMEGDAPTRPWRIIFVPIYLVEVLLFAGCILGDFIKYCCN
jgi:hypothetical protein